MLHSLKTILSLSVLTLLPFDAALANTPLLPENLNQCRLMERFDGQEHHQCQLGESKKTIQVLKLTGSEEHTAYYHGLFLRQQIETGLLQGIRTELGRSLAALEPLQRQKFEGLSQCILKHMEKSSSQSFKNTLQRFHRGMRAAGSKVTYEEILQANLMVDLSIYFETLERQLSLNPGRTQREMIVACGPHLVGQQLLKTLQQMSKTFQRFKMGCTGVSANADTTSDRALVLGRNFDTGLLGFFEKHPTILLKNLPNGTKTVGLASAGLHYAGGISGFNSHGLVVSLHQLQTDDTGMKYKAGTAETTPYLLQRVLNEARNIDEAFALVKTTEAFGAWTIFIGDSRRQELASIEITGRNKVLARRTQGPAALAQSNHYLSPVMQKAGYEYSLNKSLESRARFDLVSERLAQAAGEVNYQWVINMLSGHTDRLVGPRSFGRTTTKVYTAATHVMIPQRSEFWMTIGETYPTNQGYFYGFQVNFNNLDFKIIGRTLADREYHLENWYRSQKHYVLAYLHQEDNYRSLPQTQRVIDELSTAIELAQKDSIEELPYYYIRGRMEIYKSVLLIKQKRSTEALAGLANAQKDFHWILEKEKDGKMNLHVYEKALAQLWFARAQELAQSETKSHSDLSHHWSSTDNKLLKESAQGLLKNLVAQHPNHQGLKKVYDSSLKSLSPTELLNLSISFGTVE